MGSIHPIYRAFQNQLIECLYIFICALDGTLAIQVIEDVFETKSSGARFAILGHLLNIAGPGLFQFEF